MRPIYEAESLYVAQMLVDQLASCRIPTIVRNAHLQGALGELPMTLNPIVCVVDDRDWAQAVIVAGEFVKDMERAPGPQKTCAHCQEQSPGNFTECWKCRAPFPQPDEI